MSGALSQERLRLRYHGRPVEVADEAPVTDVPRPMPVDRATYATPANRPLSVTDPRWVLAVRTHALMQGTLLTPDMRDRLVRLGRRIGLNPFESNLVIAIVQDQARRGCGPAAAAETLAFVPISRTSRRQRRRSMILWTTFIFLLEIFIILLAFV